MVFSIKVWVIKQIEEGIEMSIMRSIKYAVVIVTIVGLIVLVDKTSLIEAGKGKKLAQFETIDFEFKIYTIRGHEYLAKENVGLVHMADCRLCEG